jgi:hypothetical protein
VILVVPRGTCYTPVPIRNAPELYTNQPLLRQCDRLATCGMGALRLLMDRPSHPERFSRCWWVTQAMVGGTQAGWQPQSSAIFPNSAPTKWNKDVHAIPNGQDRVPR